MTVLRIINIFIWAVMLMYMARGAMAAGTKGARYGDPMRLACALTANGACFLAVEAPRA